MQVKGYNVSGRQLVLYSSIVLNIALWIVVLATFPKNSPFAILHYTAGVGIDFIGSGWQIVVLPSIGTLVLILNSVLARFVERVSDVAFWIFWASLPVMEALLIVTYGLLLRLNS